MVKKKRKEKKEKSLECCNKSLVTTLYKDKKQTAIWDSVPKTHATLLYTV